MKLISVVEQYRLDSEEEVKEFIDSVKATADEKGYSIKSYSSTLKEKKKKGVVVADGYLVKIAKEYDVFWDEEE